MAIKVGEFNFNPEVTVEVENGKATVEAKDGQEFFKAKLEEAGLDAKEYEKFYKFDKEFMKKGLEFVASKSEEIFKEHKDAGTIEFNLPLSTHKEDRIRSLVEKDKEVKNPMNGETFKKTAITMKAETKRYAVSKARRKQLEEELRNKILGS